MVRASAAGAAREQEETMKAPLILAGILSTFAIAAPAALADGFITDTLGGNGHAIPSYRFITDTLGGNGHAKSAVQSYRFITDTLSGKRHLRAPAPGYQFMTDTLAPGGGSSLAAGPSAPGFNWADAGVGAGTVAGALTVLAAGLLAVRRRNAIPV
jgi:hypothetical protein